MSGPTTILKDERTTPCHDTDCRHHICVALMKKARRDKVQSLLEDSVHGGYPRSSQAIIELAELALR